MQGGQDDGAESSDDRLLRGADGHAAGSGRRRTLSSSRAAGFGPRRARRERGVADL